MNKNELTGLSELLQTGIQVSSEQVPSGIPDTEFVTEKTPTPSVCPNNSCNAGVKQEVETDDESRRFICHNGCDETRPAEEFVQYRFDPNSTLEDICNSLGLSPSATSDNDLPKYVTRQTEEDIEVCLIGNPHQYSATVEELIKRAIKHQRALVILTPAESIEGIIDVARYYPLGSLVCPLPLSILTNESKAKSLVSNASSARKRVKSILADQGLDFTGTIDQLGQNPSLIEASLTYMQVIREEGKKSKGLGAEFEEVCKAAFASLGVATELSFGGTTARGEKLPDIALALDADPTPSDEYNKALGLVDAKSGKTARFSSEKIAGKHTDYLKTARRLETYRNWHLCHIFVVFDIDGYKDIDWFDQIRDSYDGYDDNVTMVILYADALQELVAAHRNPIEKNELKRSHDYLSRVLRPLFDHHVHDADWIPADLESITRVSQEEPTKREQQYINDYYRRPQLLVVTPEMVDTHLRMLSKQGGEFERLLGSYTN